MAGKLCVKFSSIKLQENPFSDSQAYRHTDRQVERMTHEKAHWFSWQWIFIQYFWWLF